MTMLCVFLIFFVTVSRAESNNEESGSADDGSRLLDWNIIKPKAYLGTGLFRKQTVASNAVDGKVPNNTGGAGYGFLECAVTVSKGSGKNLTIDLHRPYLISFVRVYLRDTNRAMWQNGLRVYVGPNNGTSKGNTQCGQPYTYVENSQIKNEAIFNCTPPTNGRFIFIVLPDTSADGKKYSLHVCEVAVQGEESCGEPLTLPHAQLPHAQYYPMNTVENSALNYTCAEGYELNGGNAESTCQKNGQWSRPTIECNPVVCPGLRVKDRIKIDSYNYTYSNVITFSCKTDWTYPLVLVGSSTTKCLSNKTWSHQVPDCSNVRCDLSKKYLKTLTEKKNLRYELPNSNRIDSKARVFATQSVSFSCQPGHKLIGSEKSVCVINKPLSGKGKWNSDFPLCKKLSCGDKPNWTGNLIKINSTGTNLNDIAFYTCKIGYTPRIPQKFVCQQNEIWTPVENLISCSPVDCGPPKDPLNGYHTELSESYVFWSTVRFTCYKGYRLEGAQTSTCNLTGKWDSSSPRCTVMRCSILQQKLHLIIDLKGREVNDSATFSCDEGYDLVGAENTVCDVENEKAVWSNNLPTCRAKRCPRPGTPFSNGKIEGTKFFYPNQITFSCSAGHRLSNVRTPTWKCNEKGSWTDENDQEGRFPTCEPVSCGNPPSLPNGKFEGNEFTYRKLVAYSCDAGFKFSGPATLTCLHTRSWSSPSPECIELNCPTLSAPQNGAGIPGCLEVNCDVKFTCNSGYEIAINDRAITEESVELRCKQVGSQQLARAEWEGKLTSSPPTCKPKNCGSLPNIENGKVRFEPNTLFQGKAIYSCNDGYEIRVGDQVRSCGTNGLWDGSEPFCEHKCAGKTCPAYQKCTVLDNLAKCVCIGQDQCTSEYNLVCGSDGKTHNNECLMKVSGCNSGKSEVTVAKEGECKHSGVCLTDKPSPPEGSNCRGVFPRYYFNYLTGLCEKYLYSGCFQGQNSFETTEECEETCQKDPCRLEKDSGNCDGKQQRWYYNTATRRCERFHYSGCFGNENNFVSEERCLDRCIRHSVPTVLPPTPSPVPLSVCCDFNPKKNREICSQNKYVIFAKVKEITSSASYNIRVIEIVKGNKNRIGDIEKLRISRDGRCSDVDCPSSLEEGEKYIFAGTSVWKEKSFHLDSAENYIELYEQATVQKLIILKRLCGKN